MMTRLKGKAIGWRWFFLCSLAALLAVAVFALPRLTGGAESAAAQGGIRLELDMVPTNGSGPCNPIDASRISAVGGPSYQIAVCLTNSGAEPAGFQFNLIYDDSLNQCVPAACGPSDTHCLDSNPDANAGSTVFSTPNLGSGYDCSSLGLWNPVCDGDPETGPGRGDAYLSCLTTGIPSLPVGSGVSSPLAMVTFNAIARGVDNISLSHVAIYDPDVYNILSCPGGPGTCYGGTDYKGIIPTAAPPTPTWTPAPGWTPGPTWTPGGPTPPSGPIAMSSYPGEPFSGVTGSTTITNSGPIVVGSAVANGIASFYPAVVVLYFTGQNCNPTTNVALLLFDPGAADQALFLTDGVTLGDPPTSPAVLWKPTNDGVYLGGAASIQSAEIADLTGFNPVTHAYRKADVQHLACGNADGSQVTSPFGGMLRSGPTINRVDTIPPIPGDFNGDTVADSSDGSPGSAPPNATVEIDMNPTNGAGPCNPVDATVHHSTGQTYAVAVCLTDSLAAPAAFGFTLRYDDSLNQCVPVACTGKCGDGNPDANLGLTVFSSPDLGTGWDCQSWDGPPSCDQDPSTGAGHGAAYVTCATAGGTTTLPYGTGVSSPIAEVKLRSSSSGIDNLSLENVTVADEGVNRLVARVGTGATDINQVPTPTPTRRPGVGGVVNLPPAAHVAPDSDAPSDGSGWPAGAYAGLAGAGAAAVIVLGAGGWYARRRRLR